MPERTTTDKMLAWVPLLGFIVSLAGVIGVGFVTHHRVGATELLVAENAKGIQRNDDGIDALFLENERQAREAENERSRIDNETGLKVLELELRQQTIIENQQRLEQGQNLLLQEIRRLGN